MRPAFMRPASLLACLALSLRLGAQQPASAPQPAPVQAPAPKPQLAPTPTTPAYLSDPKFLVAYKDAKQLEKQHSIFALDGYKKANKIAGGACISCLQSIYDLQMGRHSAKDAVATAAQMEAVATYANVRSVAQTERGMALVAQAGDKPKPDQLNAAHDAFQQALASNAKNNAALYEDGCVLARLGRNEDASRAFNICAHAASPTDPLRPRALHFAENPALSLSKMAPAFEVTALDGKRFNLDNMGGRVVLIDFWATWCGPCNEELPHMQKIAKEFADQPFVMISISWDKDEQKWKDFIARHQMTWVQYRDADHSLSDRFGVNAIPHYFTIDSDGVLTAEMLGSGSDVEGKLKKLLKRAREARPATSQVAAAGHALSSQAAAGPAPGAN